MARVTAAEVETIIDIESSVADATIEAFINAANLTVTEILGDDTTLSSAQKKEIERWLSAHFIACTLQHKPQNEKAGDAAITYQGQTGMGLDATFYGQTVKVLDTSGKMAQKIGKKAVNIHAVTSFE